MEHDALNIRNFPADLKRRMQESAKRNYRSLTREIVFALEQYLAREEALRSEPQIQTQSTQQKKASKPNK